MMWASGPPRLAAAGLRSAKKITGPAGAAVRSTDPVLRWLPEITAAATATGVPPSLIAGVMSLESSGDPNTISVAGAVGLMQIMPDELAAHGVSYDNGFDPATNVMTGARILAERSGAGWELATGYYFGIGCDAYQTCTADYVRTALSWAAWYAPALNDSFRGDPGVIPAAWEISSATATPTPNSTAIPTISPTKTPRPKSTGTPTPLSPATKVSTATAPNTPAPTLQPENTPTATATATDVPTEVPTDTPTEIPPTEVPTETPTDIPTDIPTEAPSDTPVPDTTTPAD